MRDLHDKSSSETVLTYGLVILILLQMFSTAAIITIKEGRVIDGYDLAFYWKDSAYYLRGITLAEAEMSPLPEIGEIHVDILMPWARFLDQIMFPGFLPFSIVKIWYLFLLCSATFVLFIHLRQWIEENCEEKGKARLSIFAAGALLIPWVWYEAIHLENPGSLMAVLGVLSLFYVEEKPNLAALLLAFSVCKPQIGGLFLLIYLLQKLYGVLFRCAGILGISWILGELYLKVIRNLNGFPSQNKQGGIEVVVKLFLERIQSGNSQMNTGEVTLYYGLFDPLRWLGMPIILVMGLSAAAGVGYVLFCFVQLKRKSKNPDLLLMGAAAILASLFWAYKSPSDGIVIALCNAFMILVYLNDKEKDKKKLLTLFAGLILMNCKVIKYFIRFWLGLPHTVGITGDMVLQIIVFTYYFMIYINSSYEIKGQSNG